MTSRKGFTLIELMVVIFIVGILAAVAIPIMRGRIDAAKWSEGKAAAGSIRTAIRALHAEKGPDWTGYGGLTTLQDLGFAVGDLDGRYFKDTDYGYVISSGDPLAYVITVTATPATSPEAPANPASITLDQDGTFTP
jgi:prepilin-type N-terminal cleavage/methylation domain-containing protein